MAKINQFNYKDVRGKYNWHYANCKQDDIWIGNPEGDIIGSAVDERCAEEICAALNIVT